MNIPSIRPRSRARIEIIPLIDIMFFLLATFVMVSLSMVKNRGIPLILPAANTGAAQDRQDHVTVSIAETGQLYLDQRELHARTSSWPNCARCTKQTRTCGSSSAAMKTRASASPSPCSTRRRKLGIGKVAFETRPKPAVSR